MSLTDRLGAYRWVTEDTPYVVRLVRLTAPTELIVGPFASSTSAAEWLDEHRADLDLIPYQAPQIMPLCPLQEAAPDRPRRPG